jgi:citrate lyase beta subunit
MLKSYFFIPANNPKFIEKRDSLACNNIVFDLEDAVLDGEYASCLANLSQIAIKPTYFVRFSFFKQNTAELNTQKFAELLNIGFENFLIPKFSDITQVQAISKFLQSKGKNNISLRFVIIVEHPKGLFNLVDTLQQGLINVTGVGLGSHDFCNTMGMKHTLENLSFARQYVLTAAKAFGIEGIDIVSTNLADNNMFRNECLNGFNLGYDAKFLIHPRQLEILNSIEYYSADEIAEAELVYNQIKRIESKEISVVEINGKVYEKPHIQRIINIVNWRNSHGSK